MDSLASKRRLITLGTGSGLPVRGRGGPAHLIEVDDYMLLLDCGETAAAALLELDALSRLNGIVITHLHPDHVSGLLVLIHVSKLSERRHDLHIYMPAEGIDALQLMRDACYIGDSDLENLIVTISPLEPGNLVRSSAASVTVWASDHFINDPDRSGNSTNGSRHREAFGVTVDSGDARLVYTADVASVECFRDQLRPGVTLLSEAMHIDWKEVLALADEKSLRQVIFTHVHDRLLKPIRDFTQNHGVVYLAEDGNEFAW